MSDDFESYLVKELRGFENYLRGERRSENTIALYTRAIRYMFLYFKKRAEEITPADLNRYKTYLSTRKKYSKNTMYAIIEAIKVYFKYRGIDAASKISSPKRPKKMPVYLTEEEVRRLLHAAEGEPRDFAILSFLAYSGLRVSELCDLKIEDVDFSERIVHVRSGKGDKDRIVVVSPRAMDALENYLSSRTDSMEYLFSSRKSEHITRVQVFRIVRKYATLAGIHKDVTPHVLRHTLATTLLRRGVDIRYIQQFLGHSSVATTQIYTHVNDQMLKSVYDKVLQEY